MPATRPTRTASLDVLRLIGALAVIAYHYGFRGALTPFYGPVAFDWAAPVLRYAHFGVQLFFLVSGYVILLSAMGRTAPRFAVDRFLRLWPTFVVCVTMTAVVVLWFGGARFQTDLRMWLANLTFLAPAFGEPFMDGAYWSIVLELVFYGWVALALAFGLLPRWTTVLLGAWIGVIALGLAGLLPGAVDRLMLVDYGAWFALGALVALAVNEGWSRVRVVLITCAAALTALATLREHAVLAEMYGLPLQPAAALWANGCVLAVFAAAVALRGTTASAGLIGAAGLTYPLYLLHQHIGYIILENSAGVVSQAGAVVLAFASVVALAWWANKAAQPMTDGLRRAFQPFFEPGRLGLFASRIPSHNLPR